jgi:hypothetical protein
VPISLPLPPGPARHQDLCHPGTTFESEPAVPCYVCSCLEEERRGRTGVGPKRLLFETRRLLTGCLSRAFISPTSTRTRCSLGRSPTLLPRPRPPSCPVLRASVESYLDPRRRHWSRDQPAREDYFQGGRRMHSLLLSIPRQSFSHLTPLSFFFAMLLLLSHYSLKKTALYGSGGLLLFPVMLSLFCRLPSSGRR